jgi:hypothetical protein
MRFVLSLVMLATGLFSCQRFQNVRDPANNVVENEVRRPVADATDWILVVRDKGPRWLGPDLWREMGLDIDRLSPDNVRLTREGDEIPYLWLATPQGPGLLFYGDVISTSVGLAGSYIVSLGEPGLEFIAPTDERLPSEISTCQTTTLATRWYEKDLVYRSTAPLDSPWFWTSLRPSQALTLTVPLTDVVTTEPATLTVEVWGQSRLPVNPDHHIRIVWNDTIVDDHFWDGQVLERWTVSVPELQEGDNNLAIAAPGGTEAIVELNWLDRVGVAWRRTLVAPDVGWQSWVAESAAPACWAGSGITDDTVALFVDGFGAVHRADVWEDEDRDQIVVEQQEGETGWLGIPWHAPSPDVVRPLEETSVEALTSIQYLVVAPYPLHSAVAPLVEARTNAGLSAKVLTPETVYDSFGRGLPEGDAIRRMVQALTADGELRYVLLVGDASADPQSYWDPANLTVPTVWVRTNYVGHTASDFGLIRGEDGMPLVALGRLPASSLQIAERMVDKTLRWEPIPRLLFVSDDEAEFADLARQLDDVQTADKILDAGDDNAREVVLDWLQSDPGTFVYVGHGSLPLLGDEKILTMEDAGRWDGPTVVAAWSCLCANFTHPGYTGLAETWLQSEKGVVAFVGPTGETTTSEQYAMAMALQRALGEGATLGDAMMRAWREAKSADAQQSFLLLGDPALQPMPVPLDEPSGDQ